MSGSRSRSTAELVVVGAGPAGLACALASADAGADVTLVEAGGLEPTAAGPGGGVHGDPGIHDRDHLATSRRRALGGTAHAWCVHPYPGADDHVRVLTPHAHQLAARPELDLPGWAVGVDELAPHLLAAARFLGLPSADDNVAPEDALDLGADWVPRWQQLAPAEAVRGEAVRAATSHPRIRILDHTEVVRLRVDGDRVRGVIGHSSAGTEQVDAPDVVLATGTMEVLRLLQLEAAAGRVPDPAGLLGRGVMDHPHLTLGHVVVDRHTALEPVAAFQDAHHLEGRWVMGQQSLSEEAATRERLPDVALQLSGHGPDELPRHGYGLRRGLTTAQRRAVITTQLSAALARDGALPPHGPGLGGWASAARRGDVAVLTVHAMVGDHPTRARRVRLVDADDHRDVAWDWSWRTTELQALRRLTRIAGDALERTGLGTFLPWPELQVDAATPPRAWTGYHHVGGAPASEDPGQGVLTPHLRHHHVGGLHVVSGAAAPNSIGAANPTLTIVALALRLAEHLAEGGGATERPRSCPPADR